MNPQEVRCAGQRVRHLLFPAREDASVPGGAGAGPPCAVFLPQSARGNFQCLRLCCLQLSAGSSPNSPGERRSHVRKIDLGAEWLEKQAHCDVSSQWLFSR